MSEVEDVKGLAVTPERKGMPEEPEQQAGLDQELLVRYLCEEATQAERAAVERWAAASPENNAELATFRRLWIQAGALPSPERVNSMWQTLHRRMNAADGGRVPVPEKPPATPAGEPRLVPRPGSAGARWRRRVPRALVLWLPAAGLAAAAAGLWLFSDPPPTGGGTIELTREVETARGERMRLQLVDGTTVELAPASRLQVRYVADGPREMELTGEAIFDVTHDIDRPMRVRAGDALAEDLGTRFSIRAYPADDAVRLAVAEGIVALRSLRAPEDSTAILREGQVGRLTRENRIVLDTAVDAGAYLRWSEDRLYYRRAPLRQVASDLERWYDVEIQILDERIASERISLDLRPRDLHEVIDAIAAPLRVRYEKRGDTIFFRP